MGAVTIYVTTLRFWGRFFLTLLFFVVRYGCKAAILFAVSHARANPRERRLANVLTDIRCRSGIKHELELRKPELPLAIQCSLPHRLIYVNLMHY